MSCSVFLILLGFYGLITGHKDTISSVNQEKFSIAQDRRHLHLSIDLRSFPFKLVFRFRFLLYDVNHGEGFNLRRDVHMRVTNLVRQLREAGQNWILVLPPWGGLYHWQSKELGYQTKIPWKTFFDLDSLNRFVPVIEFEDFLKGMCDSLFLCLLLV